MSGRDTSNTEMLSAYLDGELSSEERHEVERRLAESGELRQMLVQLRQLSDDLRLLPQYHLSEPVYDRILNEIEQLSQTPASDDRQPEFSEELIGAYLDGELADTDRQRVERQLETSNDHRQLLSELRGLQDTLKTLSTHQLDDGFADRVVRRAERETLLGSAEDAVPVTPAPEPVSVAGQSRWRVYLWTAVTVAAVVALVLSIPRGGDDGGTDLAGPSMNTETPSVDADGVPRILPREDSPALVEAGPDNESDGHEVSPRSSNDIKKYSQWELVSSIQRSSGQRLFLVYELSVTPEGVEKAAFANFLMRHQIRFRQAESVGSEHQASLLKHRFLQGVQIAPDETDGMDEIQLYLVSCEARKVDGMFNDLISRPQGFGSFFLNVTTAEAEDRVLHHLCEATGVSDDAGQAIPLLVKFAILSRSARNLGAFGKIGWIEPSLLAPPPKPTGDDMPQEFDPDFVGIEPSPEAVVTGEFACELLFVVRNLKPLDSDEAAGEPDGDVDGD